MADAALEVRDLCFGYGDIPVWEDVSFSLESGQVAFLTGPNGAGKSTLFRCLAGWLEPDDGEIYVAGEPFTGRTRLAPGTLAFAPDVPSFYDDLTAAEHIKLVLSAAFDDPQRGAGSGTFRLTGFACGALCLFVIGLVGILGVWPALACALVMDVLLAWSLR